MVGFDLSKLRVKEIQKFKSPNESISNDELEKYIFSGLFSATADTHSL
ncbi:MAG: hypothetical protein EBY88_07185, partial [Actinobacteria bacterium]|nr:hypothetical protein [Actinomycetota bacterium]